jgi:hypothetical protein
MAKSNIQSKVLKRWTIAACITFVAIQGVANTNVLLQERVIVNGN